MIDVQNNVLRFLAIDHVLVSFVTIAIGLLQVPFLAYNSPKTVCDLEEYLPDVVIYIIYSQFHYRPVTWF